MTTAATGPLAGVRVMEFGQIAAGPFAGSLLADLGADVVKIERPDGGDGMRSWPPLSSAADEAEVFSENFASVNRNKRSLTVDLKDAAAVARLKRLAARCDVVIENYRPGVLQRLGLGHDALSSVNPRLVYCSISGYGATGPYAKKGAFDVTVQGMSGLMSVTGEPGAPPVKCGVPVADFCAGLYGAYTILARLMEARATGKGAFIDCSMLGALIGVAALQTSDYFGTGKAPQPLGSAHPRNAPYQAYAAQDGWFAIGAGNNRLWAHVCAVVGVDELLDDQRFLTPTLRARHQGDLKALLDPHFARQPVAHWLAAFSAAGVPGALINGYGEALADPQTAHLALVREQRLPGGQRTHTVGCPIRLDGQVLPADTRPPALGEHGAAFRAAEGWPTP